MKALVVYESMFGNTERSLARSQTELANLWMCNWLR